MLDAKFSCFGRLMVLGGACGLAPCALADTLHVPGQHATIQAALDAARSGDVIIVAAGTYEGPGNHDLDFAGKAVTVRGDGGPGSCIISLNASPTDPRRAVHFQSGETIATVFEGFTVRAGATPAGAVADMFNGAAILVTQSVPTIRNCIFEDNHAGCWGGAVTCSNGDPLIDRCVFRNNRADDDGGGLFLWGDSRPVVINSLFVGNQAPVTGGAVANFGGVLTMTNCTFVSNDANWGHAIYSYQGAITNAVIWANTGNSQQIEGNTLVTYSNVEGGRAGIGNINIAPTFVNAVEGDFRLAAGSRGVDEGRNQDVPAGMDADLDGNARIRDGDGNQTDIVDMGAFEFQRACPGDWNADGGVTSQDFFDFLGAFFAAPPNADFNASGTTDSQDFFDFLGAFFTPCL